jgi:hypothetical protein
VRYRNTGTGTVTSVLYGDLIPLSRLITSQNFDD